MLIRPTQKGQLPIPEKNNRFIFLVLFAYILVEITGMLFHPMWRDEIHPWSIAGASTSLGDLLQKKACEGHPDMWYLLVYILRSLSDNPLILQLFHSGIAILTVFLILRYAPFTRGQRVLMVFGYFYLFEYAMISRNYAIGVFLVTLLLTLYPLRPRFYFLMAVLLFLLAQINVFGLIFSGVFLLAWTFEFVFSGTFRTVMLREKAILISGTLLIVAGIALSVYTIIPPPSGYFVGSSHFTLTQLTLREGIRSIATVWKAWVPIPILNIQFWGTNIIRNDLTEAILSIILVFSAGLLFIKRPVLFFLYITGLIAIIAFILMYYYGYIRHHGHLFILLIACLWLKCYYLENDFTLRFAFLEKFYGWLKKNFQILFRILLIIQLFAGVYAIAVQLFVPFSAAKETAEYIRHEHLDRFMIAGDEDVSLEPVLGYLNKEAFFFSRQNFSTYLIYDNTRIPRCESTILVMADSLMITQGKPILLIMNYPLSEHPELNLKKIRSFEKSIRYDEIYYLYLLSPMGKPVENKIQVN